MDSWDVALVRPWAPSAAPAGSLVEDSLGIGYLTSTLRAMNFRVAVVDAYTLGLTDQQTARCVSELAPRITAISLHSFADFKHFVAISRLIREMLPASIQIVGGEHATFLASEILQQVRSVDGVVRGEGEATLVELLSHLRDGSFPTLVQGAMLRAPGGEILDGGFRPGIHDLDALPRPAKDIIELAILQQKPAAVSLLSGRGCTHKCTFCTANTYLRLGGGQVWRRRSPHEVAEEFEWLTKTYLGQPGIHPMIQFQDVIFLGTSRQSIEWTDAFLTELENRHLRVPYYFMSRADAVIANQHLLERLASSGLASVEVGIETGVDRILLSYNKRNSRGGTLKAIELLQQHRICYDASGFIMFDPDVTLDELRDNGSFLRTLGHATWDRYVTRLQVFPGTGIKKELLATGRFNPAAALDDVYAYSFRDPLVGALVPHVWLYDPCIHELNNYVRESRMAIMTAGRQNRELPETADLVSETQDFYCSHFLQLIDSASAGTLMESSTQLRRAFLQQVNRLLRRFALVFTPTSSPARSELVAFA